MAYYNRPVAFHSDEGVGEADIQRKRFAASAAFERGDSLHNGCVAIHPCCHAVILKAIILRIAIANLLDRLRSALDFRI